MKKHPILIIEDQDADFQAIERNLRRLQVDNPVVRCTGVDEALEYLYGTLNPEHPEDHEIPAIILLDLRLDGSDGREVLSKVKSDDRLRPIPIIVWSGSTNPHDVEISYRLGANSFVRKTFEFTEVNQTLARITQFWLETAVLPLPSDARQ